MINPSRIRVIAVGKLRKHWLQEGALLYLKRLPGLEITELRDGGMAREAQAIRAALRPGEELVVLTEEGDSFSSLAFARQLEGSGSSRLAFVIGGADGLAAEIKAKADASLALSRFTLPHGLARVVLAEQLYRAVSLLANHPYHRE